MSKSARVKKAVRAERSKRKSAKAEDKSICAYTHGTPTPDEAAALLQEDTNIAIALARGEKPKAKGKLKERLPLSVRKELQRIAAGIAPGLTRADEPSKAKNYVALASVLGISRQMVHRYAKRPGAPKPRPSDGAHDIPAWKMFVGRAGVNEDEPDAPEPKLSAEKQAQLDIRTRTMRDMDFEFGRKNRDYIIRNEANNSIDSANAIVKREIVKAMEHELPPLLEGLEAAEIQSMIHDRLNEIWKHLPAKIRKELDLEE